MTEKLILNNDSGPIVVVVICLNEGMLLPSHVLRLAIAGHPQCPRNKADYSPSSPKPV